MIVRGARLVGGSDEPLDVLLTGGRIAGFTRGTPDGADVLDADGAWLHPGLWDAHVHPRDWGAARHRLDLSGAASAQQALALVAAAVPGADGELFGAGLWHAGWAARPSLAALDAVTGALPTVLASGDSHGAWFNSAALRRYGLTAGPTGLVEEGPWFAVMPTIGRVPEAIRDRWVIEAGRAAAALGVVGIVDLDPGAGHDAWRRRVAAGFDAHRVRAGVWADRLDEAVAAGLRTGDPIPGAGPLVAMGPLKIIADGSLNTRTAWCHEPFLGGDTGAPNLTEAELRAHLATATAAGIECAIHAIGDRANTAVLDAFEATGAHGSLEHAQLLADTDVPRLAALSRAVGLVASVQPHHAMTDRDVVEHLWGPDRAARTYRFRDMVAAGVRLALGSDAPVSPLDPWLAITAAVARTDDERPAWHPEQGLDVATALRASTRSTLAVGQPADLVLLDADPLATPPGAPVRPGVLATLCGGVVTHRA